MGQPNERQVSGNHYQITYQPWDFITDIEAPYLVGAALKYIRLIKIAKGISMK